MTPIISFVIPTRNEEANIIPCLDSFAKQTYPHDKLEILIADAESEDRTLELIEEWVSRNDIRVQVIQNERIVAEFGKAKALKLTRGDLVGVLDCDEVLVQEDALETYVRAFEIFPDIVGVEQYFLKIPGGSIVNNYLAICQINDPLARDIAYFPKLLDTMEMDGKVFRKFQFSPAYPALLFFKKDAITEFIAEETYEEGQVMLRLGLGGNDKMCMVDGYGVWHRYVDSVGAFVKKRIKIASKHTTRIQERDTWVTYTGYRLYLFAFLHMTVVYPLLYSIVRAARAREWLWLLHAPMCLLTTSIYVWQWSILKITRRKAW